MVKKSARKGKPVAKPTSRKAIESPALPADGWIIFNAYSRRFDGEEELIGYLVATDINATSEIPVRMAAFVFAELEFGEEKEHEIGLQIAREIAADFDMLDYAYGRWTNLLNCGRIDSTERVPAFLWGLQYKQADIVDEAGKPKARFPLAAYCPHLDRELEWRRTALLADR